MSKSWNFFGSGSSSTASGSSSTSQGDSQPKISSSSSSNNNIRSTPNILKRISNLLVLKNDCELQSYEDTQLKQYWMPDSSSKECYQCNVKFTTFRRKHHCRLCGQIFCYNCCYLEITGKVFGCNGFLKVCFYCCKMIYTYLQQPNVTSNLTSDLKSLQKDLREKFGSTSSLSDLSLVSSGSFGGAGIFSSSNEIPDLFNNSETFQSRKPSLFNDKLNDIDLSESNLTALFEEMCQPFTGLDLHLQKYKNQTFAECFLGSELVDWLLIKNKVESRSDATRIGQSLFRLQLISNVSEHNDFYDNSAIYWPKTTTTSTRVSQSDGTNRSPIFESLVESKEPSWTLEIPEFDSCLENNTQSESMTVLSLTQSKQCADDNLPEFSSLDLIPISETKSVEKVDSNQIQSLYANHMFSLLKQKLADKNLDLNLAEVLMRPIQKLVEQFQLSKYSDITCFDIRNYIHIKKLFDLNEFDYELFDGFACTKSFSHFEKTSILENPQILLLQCPLVYDKNEPKYLSLETVRLQEKEYLKQVVAKLYAMKPTLVLVHKAVAQYVQSSLKFYGITVVANVKMSVIVRLSRVTKSEVLTSLDTVINSRPRLGTCRRVFTKVLNFDKAKHRRKTIMYFEGLPIPNLGCTFFLKGNSYTQIKQIKKIVRFMLLAVYNCDLEKSYNRENLVNLMSDEKSDDGQHGGQFEEIINSRILSISPIMRFSLPFCKSQLAKKSPLHWYFSQKVYYSKMLDVNSEQLVKLQKSKENRIDEFPVRVAKIFSSKPYNRFITSKVIGNIKSQTFERNVIMFRAKGCEYRPESELADESNVPSGKEKGTFQIDIFKPENHQQLDVLYSCFCLKSTTRTLGFCVNPWVVCMELYSKSDIPLGSFLENFCFRSNFKCLTQSCQLSMLEHVRRFVHLDGCVTITLSQIDGAIDQAKENESAITVCNWCKFCKKLSPVVPISESTWFLSFAKFLELKFYARSYRDYSVDCCRHSLHLDQYQYFRSKNIVACFRYDKIDLLEIRFPNKYITIDLNMNEIEKELIDEVKTLSINGHELYSMILEKIMQTISDNESNSSLKTQLQKDQTNFKNIIEDAHFILTNSCDSSNSDQVFQKLKDIENLLSKIKKNILTTVDSWNSRFLDLLKKVKESDGSSAGEQVSLRPLEQSDPVELSDTSTEKSTDEDATDANQSKSKMKTIFSQFLTSNQTTQTFQSVFSTSEQHMLPSGQYFSLSIYESEPISIVAYALNSFEYKKCYSDTIAENEAVVSLPQNVPDAAIDKKSPHIELQFENQNCKIYTMIYFAEKFTALRKLLMSMGEEAYILSISRSVFWDARGGKSGSRFAKTKNNRFIIKDLPRTELELFVKSAEKYFDYFERKYHEADQIPTILAKVVGVYHVVYQNLVTGSSLKKTFFVMENLFYKQNVTQKFDLKGSIRNRMIDPQNQTGEIVFLDENFIKMSCESPLYVYPHYKEILNSAIEIDTKFLMELSVIDYSLLVGVDSTTNQLFIGIIDYIRTFTWSKRIETIVKKSGLLGGQGREPTIVSPEEYRQRFLKAMNYYFLEVPDHWTNLSK